MKRKRGFTLVEMLVVIGIIAILVGASVAGFSSMTKSAEKAKAQELVDNVATALTALYQTEGNWPKRLAVNGASDGVLDKDAALPLAKGKYMSLTTDRPDQPEYATELRGADALGIVSPWAAKKIKALGRKPQLSDKVNGEITIQDHLLHYALDLDGDGKILGAKVGDVSVDVRATAIVWCGGKDGVVDPYPYAGGGSNKSKGRNDKTSGSRSDDVYSWTPAQTKDVK